MTRHLRRNSHYSVALSDYLHDIRADDLLSAEEERRLAQAIARGDREARTRLIRANLRLVVTIAREYQNRGLSMDDLIGEGNLGLIRAAEEFDPRFGTRFSTYASYWVKQAIRAALTNTTATIRVPAHMVGLLSKWRRAERMLSKAQGAAPAAEQIAQELGLSRTQQDLVERALQAGRFTVEGTPIESHSGWTGLEIPSPDAAPDLQAEAEEERLELVRRLKRLDERERLVLTLRYGLEDQTPQTLKEVGRRLGVTREWVRKIEQRAIQKLEAPQAQAETAAPRRRRRLGSTAARAREAQTAQLQTA